MLDRPITTTKDRPSSNGRPANDVEFHRWLLGRYRGRATRLAWGLAVVLIVSFAIVSALLMRLDDATGRYESVRQELQEVDSELGALDKRFREVAVNLRTNDRQAAKLSACLENRIVDVTRGMNLLLDEKISVSAFLRRYRPAGCP